MNIIDYVDKYGINEFAKKPFNEVDGLVLSQLSYLKFEGIVMGPSENSEGTTVSSIIENEKYEQLYRDERYEPNNRKFFESICASKRFGGLYLNDFIDVIDDSADVQFSAMSVTDGKEFRAVVFRGTDDNMVGWKEDLNMTFKTPIPAQKYSVDYLEKVASKLNGDFYVMGHSKGGNLAVYSSMNCSDEVRDRIISIYSYDGPGFRTELLHNSCYEKIRERIHKLVPKACVIGMFGNVERTEVVDCVGVGGVIQHNPYNWVVNRNSFKRTEHIGRYSELKAEAVNMWAAEMTDEQWALLSDKLFGVLQDAGITNLNDFYEDFFGTMAKVKDAADRLDEDSRQKIGTMLSMYKESAATVAREEAKSGIIVAEHNIAHAKDVAAEKIQSARKVAATKLHNKKDKTSSSKYIKLK